MPKKKKVPRKRNAKSVKTWKLWKLRLEIGEGFKGLKLTWEW